MTVAKSTKSFSATTLPDSLEQPHHSRRFCSAKLFSGCLGSGQMSGCSEINLASHLQLPAHFGQDKRRIAGMSVVSGEAARLLHPRIEAYAVISVHST